ncbi:MAG: helix-turn-helix domain-containing protein [Parasporobacterium sp.]|nr:helix-turn-helix domain-containing protein [Parasporobacterium sp.]
MTLSMWIVYDWLEKYQPTARIRGGGMTIHGVRFLEEDLELKKEYLYIGYSDEYIDKWDYNVICVNGTDLIVLTAPSIYVIFNEIQQMLEYYNNWETRLLQAMNEEQELQELLSVTTPVLKTGIAVSDLSHKLLAHADFEGREEKLQLENGYLTYEEMRIINRQMQENVSNHEPYIIQSSQDKDINFNIFSQSGNLLGSIISLSGGEGENVNSRLQLMGVFGRLMNLWFRLHEKTLRELTLFRDVLELRETDPEIIALRMEGMGWGDEPEMQLLMLRPCTSVSLGIPFIFRFLESVYAGVRSIRYREQYLLVVNFSLTERKKFLSELTQLMEKQSAYCGCSHTFTNLNHLLQNYQQAEFAAEYGDHTAGAVNRCEDYALEYMQEKLRSAIDANIISPVLSQLEDHDSANGTDYYRTLYTYLLCERNQTLAARKLFIHRNSLVYRIGRIASLIGIDLDDERERMYLLLSYFMREKL